LFDPEPDPSALKTAEKSRRGVSTVVASEGGTYTGSGVFPLCSSVELSFFAPADWASSWTMSLIALPRLTFNPEEDDPERMSSRSTVAPFLVVSSFSEEGVVVVVGEEELTEEVSVVLPSVLGDSGEDTGASEVEDVVVVSDTKEGKMASLVDSG
jgi:hypothetical protein